MPTIDELRQMTTYFQTQATRSLSFRKKQLHLLRDVLEQYEAKLNEALYKDLHKSPEESWVTETGFVRAEINDALKNLHRWLRPEKVCTNLANFPSSSRVYAEPLGVVLIISPWNYPVNLLLAPLVGAIAAGNCVVLKPSEFAPATSAVLKEMIESVFAKDYICIVEGDGEKVIPAMMNHFTFQHVFYTGSTAVGKIIYEMAASRLVPVTLELGGKSPCIVEADADITVAAKRITLAKFSNAGQMCVAPDYLLVHASIEKELTEAIIKNIQEFFGEDARTTPYYGRIINRRQLERLKGYIKKDNVLYGGNSDADTLYMQPTVLSPVKPEDDVMQDEIFGPILPVILFTSKHEVEDIISQHPNPLAFYVFTSSAENEQYWLDAVSFGGGCRNNCSLHLTNVNLPFGGRGASGIGNYHGKNSFDTFSHKKSWMKTPTWFDPKIKYPPYEGKLGILKKIIG